jgi:hypothetical protein
MKPWWQFWRWEQNHSIVTLIHGHTLFILKRAHILFLNST